MGSEVLTSGYWDSPNDGDPRRLDVALKNKEAGVGPASQEENRIES